MGNWFSQSEAKLQRELEAQKKVNEQLREEIRELREMVTSGVETVPVKMSSISREKIKQWVEEQLADPTKNIGWMPDVVERKIKTDIMFMVANMFDHILETTKIQFLGHEIKFDMIQKLH